MAGRLAGSLGFCLALLLAGPSGAMQWGVNGHPFTAYPGVDYGEQIALVAGMGATSYRVNVSHADQAPYLARLVEAAKAQGVVILPVLTPGVDLEGEDPGQLRLQARDFATTLAERFKDDIPVWELGNELENFAILQPCETRDDGTTYPCDWGPAGGVGALDYFGPRWAKVSAVLRGLSEGVEAVDPGLRKAIGTAGWGHVGAFERMRADGLDWDISVWHVYGEDPEWAFERLAGYDRPIWVTEINHPLGSQDGEAAQAEGLRRMMLRLVELSGRFDLEAAHLYQLLDEPYWAPSFEAFMGLVPLGPLPGDGWKPLEPKPAYAVARAVMAGEDAGGACAPEAMSGLEPLELRQAAYAQCLILGRAAEQEILETWAQALAGGEASVPVMLESLLRAPEFRARHAPEVLDDAGYVAAVYRLLLRREPDVSGRADYLARLADGLLDRIEVALALIGSAEFAERHALLAQAPVAGPPETGAPDCEALAAEMGRAGYAYCLVLGRAADPQEVAAAAETFRGGGSGAELVASLAGSAEFAARHQTARLSDADYVALVYRLLLEREADAAGLEEYAGALASGALTREAAVLRIAQSPEFAARRPALAPRPEPGPAALPARGCDLAAAAGLPAPSARRATYAYCLVLGRDPSRAELEAVASRLDGGASTAELLEPLLGSAEFSDRYGVAELDDAGYVALVYRLLLERDPDGVGTASYVAGLGAGDLSRAVVAMALVDSGEFAEKRPALAAPPPRVLPQLTRPRDCDLDATGADAGPIGRQVAYAHCLILGQPAEPEALLRWTGQIAAGETDIGALMTEFVASPDFAERQASGPLSSMDFVRLIFGLFLGREPDGRGLRDYAGRLAAGTTTRAEVAGEIFRSSEFAERHPVLGAS